MKLIKSMSENNMGLREIFMICIGILVWFLVNLLCVYLEDVRYKKLKK